MCVCVCLLVYVAVANLSCTLILSVIKLAFVSFLNLTVCTIIIAVEKLKLILADCAFKLKSLINRSN